MKETLLIALFVTGTSLGFSQIYKGQFLVGGNAGFRSEKEEGFNQTIRNSYLNVSPDLGYFLVNNLAAGIRPEYIQHTQTGPFYFRNRNILLSPFLRYYFLPGTERINFFIDASVHASRNKQKTESGIYKSGYTGMAIFAGPAFFINSQIALEFTMGFNRDYEKGTAEVTSSLTSKIGFQYHLGKPWRRNKS